jgi:diguanylate cyclase (GGDEF)-like protein
MEELLEKEVSRVNRSGKKLATLMIDIDHFKEFNDHYGHEAGDAILWEVGLLLNKTGRKSDVACRYGGEEMVMVFPETGLEEATLLAQKTREAINRLSISHRSRPLGPITVSVGVAVCPDDGKTVAEVLRAADIALYHAKATGRDKVVVWQQIPEAKNQGISSPSNPENLVLHSSFSSDGGNGNGHK